MISSSSNESASASWTLQASDRDYLRITTGVVIGEDARGRLELSPTEKSALLRFEVRSEAVYVRLVSREWALTRDGRVLGDSYRCERNTEIRLPNNVIRLIDGSNPAAPPERIDLTRRVSMKWLLPVPAGTETPPADAPETRSARASREIARSLTGQTYPEEPVEVSETTPVSQPATPAIEPQAPQVAVEVPVARTQPPVVRRSRITRPWLAAAIAVGAGIGIALIVQILPEENPPEANRPAEARGVLSSAPTAPPPLSLSAEDPNAIDTSRTREPELPVADTPSPETNPVTETTIEPVASAPVRTAVAAPVPAEDPPRAVDEALVPTAKAPLTIEPAPRATDRVAEAVEVAPPPAPEEPTEDDASDAPEPEPEVAATPVAAAPAAPEAEPMVAQSETFAPSTQEDTRAAAVSEADDASSTLETRQRLLLAADVALAQGRLTSPPEANAYLFYQRILALDPDSPEATAGLSAVRQALVNRTLAQLAANALDDARTSLEAAAQAGVNPQLVADLRGEVENRQRQSDVRASQLETLPPTDRTAR